MEFQNRFADLLIKEVRRRLFEESIPRIQQCLGMLEEEEVWSRPNGVTNAVGNLVMHVCGNARQWIVGGLGGAPDQRQRDAEFDPGNRHSKQALLTLLAQTEAEINRTLDQLRPEQLLQPYQIQGFDETGLSILVHVVEHFSYHTGQITFYVKQLKNEPTHYYSGLDLNTKNKGPV